MLGLLASMTSLLQADQGCSQGFCGGNSSSGSNVPQNMDQANYPTNQYLTTNDRKLYQNIRNALTNTYSNKYDNISVNVTNGDVALQGVVATQEDKEKIEQMIRDMPDVRNLNNKLEVSSDNS